MISCNTSVMADQDGLLNIGKCYWYDDKSDSGIRVYNHNGCSHIYTVHVCWERDPLAMTIITIVQVVFQTLCSADRTGRG